MVPGKDGGNTKSYRVLTVMNMYAALYVQVYVGIQYTDTNEATLIVIGSIITNFLKCLSNVLKYVTLLFTFHYVATSSNLFHEKKLLLKSSNFYETNLCEKQI